MSDDQVRLHFQVIRRQLTALQREDARAWQEIDAALEDLHVIYEQMQTNLEAAEIINEGLLQQNQHIAKRYHHYCDLFQSLPIPYLVTDVDGIILEANGAIAQLLNVHQSYLPGKLLFLYVAEGDRSTFYRKLSQLSQCSGIQVWQINLRSREDQLLTVELHIDTVGSGSGLIEGLQIAVYHLSQPQEAVPSRFGATSPTELREARSTYPAQQQTLEKMGAAESMPTSRLPQSLDGLQVLIVDDEVDAREFITTLLESYGIGVRTVASAAAALTELEQFRPDVLVSDIRMPGGSGYDLIRQIRALEAKQGGHIPAVAITAYQDEDWQRSLKAGYEAHLHKLAQPTEWIEMVVQLAGRSLQ